MSEMVIVGYTRTLTPTLGLRWRRISIFHAKVLEQLYVDQNGAEEWLRVEFYTEIEARK